MAEGLLTLRRFNGEEVYRTKTAVMWAYQVDGGAMLWFEVATERPALQTCPDTAEMGMNPSAQVGVRVESIDLARLAGSRFSIPVAYDESTEEHVATLYYCEHEDLDENEIQILERKADYFHVLWTGTTNDVNYYDGSKPRARVEIQAWFEFEDIEKWR